MGRNAVYRTTGGDEYLVVGAFHVLTGRVIKVAVVCVLSSSSSSSSNSSEGESRLELVPNGYPPARPCRWCSSAEALRHIASALRSKSAAVEHPESDLVWRLQRATAEEALDGLRHAAE